MIIFILFWVSLVVYSFTRQDLNLTWYNQLTVSLQALGWYQRPLATGVFVALCLLIFGIYLALLKKKNKIIYLLIIAAAGIFAYPMFSYDLFNYLFNAKNIITASLWPLINVSTRTNGLRANSQNRQGSAGNNFVTNFFKIHNCPNQKTTIKAFMAQKAKVNLPVNHTRPGTNEAIVQP